MDVPILQACMALFYRLLKELGNQPEVQQEQEDQAPNVKIIAKNITNKEYVNNKAANFKIVMEDEVANRHGSPC